VALLITDLVMPYMSGLDLAKQLVESAPDLPVLYVSGYIDRPLPAVGPDGKKPVLLEKPFLPRTLVRQVRELLDASPRGRRVARAPA
jgi:FixJ family two-component response regulator